MGGAGGEPNVSGMSDDMRAQLVNKTTAALEAS